MLGPLDALIRTHVAPVMIAAGFSREGRTFRRSADNGDQVFLAIGAAHTRPQQIWFPVAWTVLPITQWRWFSRNELEPGPPNPNATWFFTNDLSPPDTEQSTSWSFDPDDDPDGDRCGRVLARVVAEDLALWLVSMLDRDALLAELRSPTRAWMPGMSGPPRRRSLRCSATDRGRRSNAVSR